MKFKHLLLCLLIIGLSTVLYGDEKYMTDEEIYTNFSFDTENAEQLKHNHVLNELIIKFKDVSKVPGKERQLQHEKEKLEKLGFKEEYGIFLIKVEDLEKNPNAIMNRYKNNRFIEYVEPNYILK